MASETVVNALVKGGFVVNQSQAYRFIIPTRMRRLIRSLDLDEEKESKEMRS